MSQMLISYYNEKTTALPFCVAFKQVHMVEHLLVVCVLVRSHTVIEVSWIFGKAKMICDLRW